MKAHLLRSAARSLLLPASLILATPVRALATAIHSWAVIDPRSSLYHPMPMPEQLP